MWCVCSCSSFRFLHPPISGHVPVDALTSPYFYPPYHHPTPPFSWNILATSYMYLLQVKCSAYQWMHIWLTVNGYVVVFSAHYQSFIVCFCSYFPTAYIPSPDPRANLTVWLICVVHTKAISLTPECVVYSKLSFFLMLYNRLAHIPPPHSPTLDVWCSLSLV